MNVYSKSPYLYLSLLISTIKSTVLLFGNTLSFNIILFLNTFELIIVCFYLKFAYRHISTKIILLSFILACFLYCTIPSIFYIFAPKFATFFNDTLLFASLFSSTFFSWLCFWLLLLFGERIISNFEYDLNILMRDFDVSSFRTIGVTIFGLLLLIIYVNNYYVSGASTAVLNSSRFEITKTVETGRIWLIQYAMAAYFIWMICFFMIGRKKRNPFFYVFITINILISTFYLYYYFQLGNRREFLIPVLFFLILRYVKNNKADVSLILIAIVAMTWIGISRVTSVTTTAIFLEDSLFAGLGEFLLTSFPLNLYIESGEVSQRYGITIIQSIFAGTPLIDAEFKPLSLANEFVEIFSRTGIGYGFSPMAESYLNFGFVGALLGPIALVMTISFVSKFTLPYRGLALLVLASSSFDIFRGESGSMFWQFVVIYGILFLFCFRWQPGASNRTIDNDVRNRERSRLGTT